MLLCLKLVSPADINQLFEHTVSNDFTIYPSVMNDTVFWWEPRQIWQIQSTVTGVVDFSVACGESHQTAFKNRSVLWVIELEDTLWTLWNTVSDEFLINWVFL